MRMIPSSHFQDGWEARRHLNSVFELRTFWNASTSVHAIDNNFHEKRRQVNYQMRVRSAVSHEIPPESGGADGYGSSVTLFTCEYQASPEEHPENCHRCFKGEFKISSFLHAN